MPGGRRSGEGLRSDNSDYLTVQDLTAAHRSTGIYISGGQDLELTDNSLTDNAQAIYVQNVAKDMAAAAVMASGNVFTNSVDALEIRNITGASAGLTIGPAVTNHIVLDASSRLETVTGNVLHLHNVDDVTIDALDVSSALDRRSGIGILGDGSSDNWVIQNVTATNRSTGIQVTGGGTDLTLTGNDLSNNNTALYIDGITDGGDTDSLPIMVSGTEFTGSNNALQLNNMSGITIGTTGTEAVVVAPTTDGLRTASGTVFNLTNLPGLTMEGMDLSYTGDVRSGAGIVVSNAGNDLLLEDFTINNRATGIQVSSGQDLTVEEQRLVQ